MRKQRPFGVLIASENRIFRDCLADRIAREKPFHVGGVSGAAELLTELKRIKPDLLLFDTDALGPMPESLLPRVRQSGPDVRILALGMRAGEQEVARVLRYGASGLIGKNESLEKFFRAMKAVASGETWAGRKATARALMGLAEERRRTSASLTPRERQLLSLLSDGYRNKELASLLKIKEQTVKIHLHSLFKKLNVSTRVEAVLKAVQQT